MHTGLYIKSDNTMSDIAIYTSLWFENLLHKSRGSILDSNSNSHDIIKLCVSICLYVRLSRAGILEIRYINQDTNPTH